MLKVFTVKLIICSFHPLSSVISGRFSGSLNRLPGGNIDCQYRLLRTDSDASATSIAFGIINISQIIFKRYGTGRTCLHTFATADASDRTFSACLDPLVMIDTCDIYTSVVSRPVTQLQDTTGTSLDA